MDGFADPGLTVVGIDPGLSGALAMLDENHRCVSIAMPVMDGMVDGGAVARWLGQRDPNIVVIEFQQAMPEHLQKRKQGSSSTFKLGRNYGQLLGILQAGHFSYITVQPAKWKRDMRLPYAADPRERKEIARRRAIELLPKAGDQFHRKMDEARAEAALIAWWYLHERNPTQKERAEISPGP